MIDLYFFKVSVELLWLAIGILIAGTEFLFPTFASMWSGAAAMLIALFIKIGLLDRKSFTWQFFWFFIISIILLLFWFFYLKKIPFFNRLTGDLNRDATLTNIRGIVIEDILPGKSGLVELYKPFHGIKKWKAESKSELSAGTEIFVIDADGISLIVKKLEAK